MKKIIDKINKSNANFAKRLKENNRKYTFDWEDPTKIVTHKLSVGTDNDGIHFIYPEAQEINGTIVDFTNPLYDKWVGQKTAINRKDTVQIGNTPKDLQEAIDFTKTYKTIKEYPKFKYGGMKQNKSIKLKGGMAIPLDKTNKLFYLSGAKHEQGGIDITPELEAEGGEVVKINPKSIKVVTAQKIMGGKSPAELVVNASPTGKSEKVFNKVFDYQENFKDRYNLNDDGTKKARFGIEENLTEPRDNTKTIYGDNYTHDDNVLNVRNKLIDKFFKHYIITNVNKLGKEEFIKRLHDNLIPFGYGKDKNKKLSSGIIKSAVRIFNAINGNKQEEEIKGQLPGEWNRKMLEDSGVMDIYGEYLGIPKEDRYFSNSYVKNSNYKPTISTDKNIEYKTLYPLPEKLKNNIINEGMKLKLGEIKESPIQDEAFNTYTISRGKDDKGEYISFYDKWDLNPTRGTEGNKLLKAFSNGKDPFVAAGVANPLEFYDRIYLNDINKKQLGGEMKNKKKANLGIFQSRPSELNVTNTPLGVSKSNTLLNRITQENVVKMQNPVTISDISSPNPTITTQRERLLNTGDWINIGANALGATTNLLTGLLTPDIKYARMRDAIPITTPKINSNVNTTAEESAIDEAYNDEIRAINENTADSKTALNRKRNAALRKRNAKVKIRANAENIRKSLINEGNKLASEYQKYNIARQENVDAYNAQAKAAEFNANRTKISDAITGFVSDLTTGASTIANTLEQRNQFDKNLQALGLTYPNVDTKQLDKVINGDKKVITKTKNSKEEKKTQKEREKILRNARKNKLKMIRQELIKPEDI